MNFFNSQFDANEKLLRKLGPSETIYDYELTNKCHIFVMSMQFDSKVNLFSDIRLIENSCRIWKSKNPLLRTKIVGKNKHSADYFSNERYFLLDNVTSSNLDNIGLYKLKFDQSTPLTEENIYYFLNLLYEREFNNEPFDQTQELLWRLIFVELKQDEITKKFSYCILFNIHHGITDGNNAFSIMAQLLKIIDDTFTGSKLSASSSSTLGVNIVLPSVERLLLKEDLHQRLNKETQSPLDSVTKIPKSFLAPTLNENETLEIDNDATTRNVTFLCVKPIISKSPNWRDNIYGLDLALQRKFTNVTKFKEISIDADTFRKLVIVSKSNQVKLTGCLNLIYLLATHKSYLKYSNENEINFHIYYHLMVNLRSFLNIDAAQMGFFVSVLTCEFKFDSNSDGDHFELFVKKFWQLAKIESDTIHKRLSSNEHIEAAKCDGYQLLKQIKEGKKFVNGGGVHYALSNLGVVTPPKLENICINKYFYQVSMEAERWSSIIFNGICSLNNRLIWGISYNSNLIRDEIIENLSNNIKKICDKLII